MLWSEQNCGFNTPGGGNIKNEKKLEKLKRKKRN